MRHEEFVYFVAEFFFVGEGDDEGFGTGFDTDDVVQVRVFRCYEGNVVYLGIEIGCFATFMLTRRDSSSK